MEGLIAPLEPVPQDPKPLENGCEAQGNSSDVSHQSASFHETQPKPPEPGTVATSEDGPAMHPMPPPDPTSESDQQTPAEPPNPTVQGDIAPVEGIETAAVIPAPELRTELEGKEELQPDPARTDSLNDVADQPAVAASEDDAIPPAPAPPVEEAATEGNEAIMEQPAAAQEPPPTLPTRAKRASAVAFTQSLAILRQPPAPSSKSKAKSNSKRRTPQPERDQKPEGAEAEAAASVPVRKTKKQPPLASQIVDDADDDSALEDVEPRGDPDNDTDGDFDYNEERTRYLAGGKGGKRPPPQKPTATKPVKKPKKGPPTAQSLKLLEVEAEGLAATRARRARHSKPGYEDMLHPDDLYMSEEGSDEEQEDEAAAVFEEARAGDISERDDDVLAQAGVDMPQMDQDAQGLQGEIPEDQAYIEESIQGVNQQDVSSEAMQLDSKPEAEQQQEEEMEAGVEILQADDQGFSSEPSLDLPPLQQPQDPNTKSKSSKAKANDCFTSKDDRKFTKAVGAGPALVTRDGVDHMLGCPKCRYNPKGCTTCRVVPTFERPSVRWDPGKGHPQTDVPLAPSFRPTLEEFQNPVEYINKITPLASKYGAAHIIPPEGWAPPFALEKGTNGLSMESFKFTTRKQFTSSLCRRHPPPRPAGGAAPSAGFPSGGRYAHRKISQQQQQQGGGSPQQPDHDTNDNTIDNANDHQVEASTAAKNNAAEPSGGLTAADVAAALAAITGDDPAAILAEAQQHQQKAQEQRGGNGGNRAMPADAVNMLGRAGNHHQNDDGREDSGGLIEEAEEEGTDTEFGFLTLDKKHTLRSFAAYADWVKSVHFNGPKPSGAGFPTEPKLRPESLPHYYTKQGQLEPSVEEIEAEFWRIVESPAAPPIETLYGQDLDSGHHGSGFPLPDWRRDLLEQHLQSTKRLPQGTIISLPPYATKQEELYAEHPWNINNMPRCKDSVLRYLLGDELITGVMVPWLYVGSCLSAFCWHVEDHALYSVNYMHLGAPKVWYAVPPTATDALEAAMQDALPHLFAASPNLLYQLVTMVSPVELKKRGVPVYKFIHEAGSFIVTMPNAYHAGFNTGFNVAEAVNFAAPRWIPYGTDVADKYRSTSKPTTMSHDSLIVSLVTAAGHVACSTTGADAAGEEQGERASPHGAEVDTDTPFNKNSSRKKGSDSKKKEGDGFGPLGNIPWADAPREGICLATGELTLRLIEEQRRRAAGLDALDLPNTTTNNPEPSPSSSGSKGTLPERLMDSSAPPAAVDPSNGVHINTADCDCLVCNCDLWLSAVVSPDAPGVAACPEHAVHLVDRHGCSKESLVLLYRHSIEELQGLIQVAEERVAGAKEAVEAALTRRAAFRAECVPARALGPVYDVTTLAEPTPMCMEGEERPKDLVATTTATVGGMKGGKKASSSKEKMASKKKKPTASPSPIKTETAPKPPTSAKKKSLKKASSKGKTAGVKVSLPNKALAAALPSAVAAGTGTKKKGKGGRSLRDMEADLEAQLAAEDALAEALGQGDGDQDLLGSEEEDGVEEDMDLVELYSIHGHRFEQRAALAEGARGAMTLNADHTTTINNEDNTNSSIPMAPGPVSNVNAAAAGGGGGLEIEGLEKQQLPNGPNPSNDNLDDGPVQWDLAGEAGLTSDVNFLDDDHPDGLAAMLLQGHDDELVVLGEEVDPLEADVDGIADGGMGGSPISTKEPSGGGTGVVVVDGTEKASLVPYDDSDSEMLDVLGGAEDEEDYGDHFGINRQNVSLITNNSSEQQQQQQQEEVQEIKVEQQPVDNASKQEEVAALISTALDAAAAPRILGIGNISMPRAQ